MRELSRFLKHSFRSSPHSWFFGSLYNTIVLGRLRLRLARGGGVLPRPSRLHPPSMRTLMEVRDQLKTAWLISFRTSSKRYRSSYSLVGSGDWFLGCETCGVGAVRVEEGACAVGVGI